MLRSSFIHALAISTLITSSAFAHNPLADTSLSDNAQRIVNEIKGFAPTQIFVRDVPLSDGSTATQTIILAGNAGRIERFVRGIPSIGEGGVPTIYVDGRSSWASSITKATLATVLPIGLLARAGVLAYDNAATSGIVRVKNHALRLNVPSRAGLRTRAGGQALTAGAILTYLGIDSVVRRNKSLDSSESNLGYGFPIGAWRNSTQAEDAANKINDIAQGKIREDQSNQELVVVVPKHVFSRVRANLAQIGYQAQAR